MEKNAGKVREIYQSEKVGNMNRTLKRIHSRRVFFFCIEFVTNLVYNHATMSVKSQG